MTHKVLKSCTSKMSVMRTWGMQDQICLIFILKLNKGNQARLLPNKVIWSKYRKSSKLLEYRYLELK